MSQTPTLIDTHQHAVPEVCVKAINSVGVDSSGERDLPSWSVEQSFEAMDKRNIAATVLSISSPGAYFGDIEFTKRLVPAGAYGRSLYRHAGMG